MDTGSGDGTVQYSMLDTRGRHNNAKFWKWRARMSWEPESGNFEDVDVDVEEKNSGRGLGERALEAGQN